MIVRQSKTYLHRLRKVMVPVVSFLPVRVVPDQSAVPLTVIDKNDTLAFIRFNDVLTFRREGIVHHKVELEFLEVRCLYR